MFSAMIDTLSIVKRLRAAGFTEEQAEAQAEVLFDAVQSASATKADLLAVKADLEKQISAVRSELASVKSDLEKQISSVRSDLEKAKAELIKWVVSVGIVQISLIATLLITLIKTGG